MRSFLQQPYPFNYKPAHKLRVCAGVGLFVLLFLALFKPFGIHRLSPQQQWLHSFFFGLITMAVSSFFQIVVPLFSPRVFAEQQWKSWKEIVFLILILLGISAGNYLLMNHLYPDEISFRSFLEVLWITVEVGIFPVVFLVFFKQMLLYRRYAAEAMRVNGQIEAPNAAHSEVAGSAKLALPLVLQGDGQKEQLVLSTGELLYIASSDNYVRVVYRSEGTICSQLLRSTLKSMEQQLAGCPSVFRCHRMYLVQLDQVTQVSGNAQGLRLHIDGVEDPIPVSRNLTQTIKERLAHLSHSPQNA